MSSFPAVQHRRRRTSRRPTRGELKWFQALQEEFHDFQQPSKYVSWEDRVHHKKQEMRERVVQFLQVYNPNKIDAVDGLLAKYENRENELMEKLKNKYERSDGFAAPGGSGPVVFLEVSYPGRDSTARIDIQLFLDTAPLAAENFRRLCTGERGGLSYAKNQVHRIAPYLCVQGGDITAGDGTGGTSTYTKDPQVETDMWGNFSDDTPFKAHNAPGLLSMANNGPNRNGSQFFFTLAAAPHLNGKHAIFGKVAAGMEDVLAMGKLATDENQRPLESVIIEDCGEIMMSEDGKEKLIRASAIRPNTDCQTVSSSSTGLCNEIAISSNLLSGSSGASTLNSTTESPFSFAPLTTTATKPVQIFSFNSQQQTPAAAVPITCGSSTTTSLSFASQQQKPATPMASTSTSLFGSTTQSSFSFGAISQDTTNPEKNRNAASPQPLSFGGLASPSAQQTLFGTAPTASRPFSFTAQPAAKPPLAATLGFGGSLSATTSEVTREEKPTFGLPSTTGTTFGSGSTSSFSFGGIAPSSGPPTTFSSLSAPEPNDTAKSFFGSSVAASTSTVSPAEEKLTAAVFGSSRGGVASFASLAASPDNPPEKEPLQQPSFVTGYREASDSDDDPSSSSSSAYSSSTDDDDDSTHEDNDSATEVVDSISTDRDECPGMPPISGETTVRGSWTPADEAIEAVTQGNLVALEIAYEEEGGEAMHDSSVQTSILRAPASHSIDVGAGVVDNQDESLAKLPRQSKRDVKQGVGELAFEAGVSAEKKHDGEGKVSPQLNAKPKGALSPFQAASDILSAHQEKADCSKASSSSDKSTDITEQSFVPTPVIPFDGAEAGASHRKVSGERTVSPNDPLASPPSIVQPKASLQTVMSPYQLASEILSGHQPRPDSSNPAVPSQKGTDHTEQSFAPTPAVPLGGKEAIAANHNGSRVLAEGAQESTNVDQHPHSSDSAFIKVPNEVQAQSNISSADVKEKSPHRSRRTRPVETIELPLGVIAEGKLKDFDHDQSLDATITLDGCGSNDEPPGTPGAVSANVSVGTDARFSSVATWESSVCEQVETLRRDIDESSSDILRTKEKLNNLQFHIEVQKAASVTGKTSFNRSLLSSPGRSEDTSNSNQASSEHDFPSRAPLQNVPSGEEVVCWSADDPDDYSKKDLSVYTSPVLVEVEKMEPRNSESGTVSFLAQKFDEHHQSHIAKQEKLDASFDSNE